MSAVFACTGTSLTTGPSNGGWPAAVQALLPTGVTFHNLGQAGSNSDWGLSNISAVSAVQADAVLIEFSMNDSLPGQNISLAKTESNLRSMISAVLSARSDTVVIPMTMNPVIGSAKSDRLELDAYYDVYRSVAWSMGLPIIDNYFEWGGPSSADIPDGIHPAADAVQAIIVPKVLRAFSQFI
jgi:acyl-CoA thioesterase-1